MENTGQSWRSFWTIGHIRESISWPTFYPIFTEFPRKVQVVWGKRAIFLLYFDTHTVHTTIVQSQTTSYSSMNGLFMVDTCICFILKETQPHVSCLRMLDFFCFTLGYLCMMKNQIELCTLYVLNASYTEKDLDWKGADSVSSFCELIQNYPCLFYVMGYLPRAH